MIYGAFSVELLTKIAIGATNRTVTIDGTQVVNVPGEAPVTNVGGLLAQSTNISRQHSQTYGVVPELGLTVGWQVTPNIRATAGYSVLWWTHVFRPGDQIDLNVNPDLIPPNTPASGSILHPVVVNQASTLWMQAARLGVEVSY
jgi:Putative beta barrel porin-7 (BBP7)